MMPPTSKSNQQKAKSMFVPKVKQQDRDWLELPYDVMSNILYRVGVFDILENAQKVCATWRKILKNPAMWTIIYMENHLEIWARPALRKMCKHAVDRSQGQLVDITIVKFANRELIEYIADRSSQLRRLAISLCYDQGWAKILKKFPLLEELSLYQTTVSKEDIEGAGHCCPMLTTLKVSQEAFQFSCKGTDDQKSWFQNHISIAIAENLPELRHLELIGSIMSNTGLQAILDGCRHLESLDLRQCFYLDLKGEIGTTCVERIKCLKLPNDSLQD